jgi:hypothetical protein
MDHEKEIVKKCWMRTRSKLFPIGKLILYRYEPWKFKECTHVYSSSMVCACNGGGIEGIFGNFLLKKHGRWMLLCGSGDRFFFNISLRNLIPNILWNWQQVLG